MIEINSYENRNKITVRNAPFPPILPPTDSVIWKIWPLLTSSVLNCCLIRSPKIVCGLSVEFIWNVFRLFCSLIRYIPSIGLTLGHAGNFVPPWKIVKIENYFKILKGSVLFSWHGWIKLVMKKWKSCKNYNCVVFLICHIFFLLTRLFILQI